MADDAVPSSQPTLAQTRADLVRAEERIVTLTEARDAVLESVAEGVLALDAQGHILAANRMALRLYGHPPGAAPPKHFRELWAQSEMTTLAGVPVPEEERPISCALRGETFRDREYRMSAPHKHGSWIAAISSAPVHDAHGSVQFAIITVRDVTEQRRAAELLEQRVAERTARLQIIHDLDRLILAARQPAEIAQTALERIVLVTGAVRATVVLFDFPARAMDVLAGVDEPPEVITAGPRWTFDDAWQIEETLAGRVVAVPRLAELPDDYRIKATLMEAGAASAAFIPLSVGGGVTGAIALALPQEGELPPDELDLLIHIADSLAIAMQNAQLIAQLVERQAELTQANAQLQLLTEIDRDILAAHSKEEIADAALARVQRLWVCDRASVLLYDYDRGQALVLAARRSGSGGLMPGEVIPLAHLRIPPQHSEGRGHVVRDLVLEHAGAPVAQTLLSQGIRSHLSLPLLADGRLIGSFNLSSHVPDTFTETALAALQPVAESLAVAVRNAQMTQQIEESQAQLQALTRRLITVQEAERRSLARELHDEVAQTVTGLSLGLAALARHPDTPPALAGRLHHYQTLVSGMMKELHAVVSALRPPVLDVGGLVAALDHHVRGLRETYALDATLAADGLEDQTLPPEYEITLYRLVQEALTNVVRHAQATRVTVRLERDDHTITVTVDDNGIGFDLQEALQRGRLGLIGMRERAEMIGGRVAFESAAGRGTRVTVVAPLQQ